MKRYLNSFFWKNLWNKLNCFFSPRQKWLTKKIPRNWSDKPELIQDILFECLVHFVEEENGLIPLEELSRFLDDPHISEEYRDNYIIFTQELFEAYNYIKIDRPEIVVKQDSLLIDSEYGEWIELERLLEDKDIWAMSTIVKHSKAMWT